jgi:hypothetical protein
VVDLQHAFTAVAEGAEFLVQAWRRVVEVCTPGLDDGWMRRGYCDLCEGTVTPVTSYWHQQMELLWRISVLLICPVGTNPEVLYLCRKMQRSNRPRMLRLRRWQPLAMAPLQ